MALKRFSREPYLRKQRELALIEENKARWKKEQLQRQRWIANNDFDEAPRLETWEENKNKSVEVIEGMMLSSIGLIDAAQTASINLSNGLGIRDTSLDMNAVEDLAYNIYMVKLADLVSGELGANLKEKDKEQVMAAIITQLFPAPAPVPHRPQSSQNTEALINGIAAIRAQNRNQL